MFKIKLKLFLFFLINAAFICSISIFSIVYVQKLGTSIENTSALGNAIDDIDTHHQDFSEIAHLYPTTNPDKYDSIKSEIDFLSSRLDQDIRVLNNDKNLSSYVLRIIDIKNKYIDLLQKISINAKAHYEQNTEYNTTLSDLEKIRGKTPENPKTLSDEIKLLLEQVGYKEKEFNFQFSDKKHSDEWIASIEKLSSVCEEKGQKELSGLIESYFETANKAIEQKNSLVNLELNYGFYLAKIDNLSIENRIQNTKAITYADAMISGIQRTNGSFKNSFIAFIIVTLILGSVVVYIYSKKITEPIIKLTDISKKIMDGDLAVRANIKTNDEIEYFATTFNKMLDNIGDKNKKLKEESVRLKILLSFINEGLILIDKNYNILLANAAASDIIKMRNRGIIGRNFKDVVEILHNMDIIIKEMWPSEIVFKTGKPITLKASEGYYFKTAEGRMFPVEMTIAPIKNGPENGIIIVFKDTTEMKLVEEEREFSRKNLESVLKSIYIERDNVQEEKNKLEALLNSMGDAVLAINETKTIIAFNPVAEKITGLKIGELDKEKFDDKIKFIEEETKKEKNDFVDNVLLKGEKIELNNLAILNQKGKMILVDINASPIRNYKDEIIGCIIIFKDVTFKREAERMRTDFISIVSHQLRTPLSAMKWFLEILLDGDVGTLKKEQLDVVNEIHESNKSMINFVNQMLNVSRIESRRLAINIEKVKICQTVDELLKEIKPFFVQKKQKLSYNCIADKKLEINTDKNLLRNVLSSVLLNASRYTPEKGSIELEVSRYNKDFVLFKVKDNGIGIPEDEKIKIFRKFARASNAIRYEANGTGLGLYIVKSIINMVCGKVWFESEENKGTTFYFTIPIENMVCEIDENDAKMLI